MESRDWSSDVCSSDLFRDLPFSPSSEIRLPGIGVHSSACECASDSTLRPCEKRHDHDSGSGHHNSGKAAFWRFTMNQSRAGFPHNVRRQCNEAPVPLRQQGRQSRTTPWRRDYPSSAVSDSGFCYEKPSAVPETDLGFGGTLPSAHSFSHQALRDLQSATGAPQIEHT